MCVYVCVLVFMLTKDTCIPKDICTQSSRAILVINFILKKPASNKILRMGSPMQSETAE